MEKNIKVGHPFFFPTQVVLVDDDPDFLDGVSLMLDKDLSYKLFQSASNALDYVNTAHQHVNFLQRCYTNYKTGPMESDSLSHIDISKLHLEVFNGSRFQTSSTVIVDYSMPEMNGLEFLMSLENPFIKKVLLTGQADMKLAIKAFNNQLIDQFIDKHDPRLKNKLNTTIATFQHQYFNSSYKLVTDPIIANNHDSFLVNTEFQAFFNQVRNKQNCVEYYMIDEPHSGFFMVDEKGVCRRLLIYTDQALAEHYDFLLQLNAPSGLLQKVQSGELLPVYNDQNDDTAKHNLIMSEWESHYFPGIKIDSSPNFYVTIIPNEILPDIDLKEIITYGDFLQANCSVSEIVH